MVVLTEAQLARIEANRNEALRRKAGANQGQRFNFGKHIGKTFAEVAIGDPTFCSWAQKQQKPSDELKQFIDFLARQCSSSASSSVQAGSKRSIELMQEGVGTVAEHIDAKSRRVQEVARPSVPQRRFFRLQRQYLENIKSGRKRWEGRLNVGAAAGVSIGCKATFSSGSDTLEMTVRSVRYYKTFEAMLCDLGVDTCLPGIGSLSQGIAIYHSFPGYAQKERQFGVVAMELMRPGSSMTLGM